MKRQNRKLSLRMKGKDVQRLQAALGLIGFSIADREGYFGKTTRQAVLTFQEQQGLEPTGIVDEETAELIEAAVVKPEEWEGPEEQHRGPSEYTRLRTALQRLLQDREVATLTEEDITYLAAKTESDPVHIAYLVKGAKLQKKTGIAAEVFYALFRRQLPTSLPALIAQDPAVQRRALESAIRNNLVGASLKASLDDVMEQLREQVESGGFEKVDMTRHDKKLGSFIMPLSEESDDKD